MTAKNSLEIGVRFLEVDIFDPGIAVAHIVAFALQLQAPRRVRDSFAAVIGSIDAGVRAAPHLVDRLIEVRLDAIEIHRERRLLNALTILEAGGAEYNIICMPFPGAIIGVI